MSRLIVKNLPKSITEEKIRDFFNEKGTITDVQLKYTPDGKFRQFAFIGYQTENEAEEATKYFNNMFINTSKIKVELCTSLGDTNKPKAWSKYATDSTAYKKKHETTDKTITVNVDESEKSTTAKTTTKKKKNSNKLNDESAELLEKYKDDPMFEEFLQVHDPKQVEKLHNLQQKSTEEDSAIESGDSDEDNKVVEEEKNKLANQKISDLEYMRKLINKSKTDKETVTTEKTDKKFNLFTLKLRDLPYNCKKKDIKQFFKPLKPYSLRIPTKIHGIAYVGFKTERDCNKALLKDRSFICGKRILVTKFSSNTTNDSKNETEDSNTLRKTKWKNQEESLKNEEDIAESGNIFIRNLSYTTVEEDVEKLFSKFGPLTEVNLPIDSITRKIKGFGTITFLMPEHAVKAYTELDGTILHGRMVHLLPGKSKDSTLDDNLTESTNYKQKKAAKQKSQASSSHNWNSLFLGHDAVAEVIADNYGTTKTNVLTDESGNAAVRLALGETQIIAQTRKYLEEQGVVLDAFNQTIKRSKQIILIKNLPSHTEIKEIRDIFEKFGLLGRVILPPSGITAIVEFFEASEARKAFSRLAYSKFKNVPLYLEWAPENSLIRKDEIIKSCSNSSKENTLNENDNNKNEKIEIIEKKEEKELEEEEEEDEPEPDTTLFVKNLNFQTTDQTLKKHFESCGKIFYANVATKKDKNDPNNKLSMGYGFVRFYLKNSVEKALKNLQQSVLDGKSLELKRSERTFNNEVNSVRRKTKLTKQTGTKILVRNIPFQANIKEIRELFSTFGEIKALRLPKKMSLDSNSHRGFAFVDYVTSSDAKNAFEALSQSTHLYGRRLVLEWASTEEGVEEIRKRTADHFTKTEEVKSKKSVFNVD